MQTCAHAIITTGCPNCRNIQNEWYDKLEAKGFEDLESMRYGEDRPLKSWHSYAFQNIDLIEMELIQEQNDKYLEFLHRHKFESKIEQRIWELHTSGLSRYQIENAVKHFKDAPKQSTIRKIIMDLERELTW